jgi:transposase, IS6 family
MLLLASSVCGLFKWRQFEPEVILLAVGWYLRFSLSYRDVEELLAERGLHADHVTVWRWVQRYTPQLERRLRSEAQTRPTTVGGWMGPTYGSRASASILYRAVDSTGATIDFLLSAKPGAAAAERFLSKALGGVNHPEPRVINTDKHAAYPPAIVRLKAEGALEEDCQHRPVQYLGQCSGTGSSDDQTTGTRMPAFSLLLGSLAHDCRLRGDPHDPQRPRAPKCAGWNGRSPTLLRCGFVRGDQLNCRSSIPRPSARLQSCNTSARSGILPHRRHW